MESSSGSHLDTEEFVEVEKREVTRECSRWSDLRLFKPLQCEAACSLLRSDAPASGSS